MPPSRTQRPWWWWPRSTSTPRSWREASTDSSPGGTYGHKKLQSNNLSRASTVKNLAFVFSHSSLTCHRHNRGKASAECRRLSSPLSQWWLWWFRARWRPAGRKIHPRCSADPRRGLLWDQGPNTYNARWKLINLTKIIQRFNNSGTRPLTRL